MTPSSTTSTCGLTCEQATTRAIGDSGPASVVARAISDALADGQARLTAAALLVSGPLLGLLWLATLVPGQWPSALLLHRPEIGLLVVTTAVFGGLTVMKGCPAVRWLALPRPAPTRSAAIACASATVCDICLLLSAAALLAGNASLGITGALAGTASLIRLALSQHVARRDLALEMLPNEAGIPAWRPPRFARPRPPSETADALSCLEIRLPDTSGLPPGAGLSAAKAATGNVQRQRPGPWHKHGGW